MRAREFLNENWGPEQHPGVLPIGDYLSPDSEFVDPTGKKDPIELHQEVDDILNAGGEPRVVRIKPSQVYATQDWLSNGGGDGPLYPEYEDRPVVYQKGRYPSEAWYVLDGHHRITAALKKHQPIDVYMFGDYQLDQLNTKKQVNEDHDYMTGHCHVMALALKKLHPDWKLRAHIGWDEEAEDDNDYRIDHVYIVAPDGSAYDCRGKFSSEEELVGPDETGGVETQFVNYDLDDIRADVARGELKIFNTADLERAVEFAQTIKENFADGKVRGKSRPGRVKRAGASCKGSVSSLRAKAKKYGGERGKMYHWCANMKGGKRK